MGTEGGEGGGIAGRCVGRGRCVGTEGGEGGGYRWEVCGGGGAVFVCGKD